MRITKKKITAVAAGAAVVTLGASAAFAYWTGTGNATGQTQLGSSIGNVDATFVLGGSGTLSPGNTVPVTSVTVTNNNAGPVKVVGFGTVAFDFDSAHSACDPSWFSLQGLPSPFSYTVPAGGPTVLPIPANTVVLKMHNDTMTDQGACKGATIFIQVPLDTQSA